MTTLINRVSATLPESDLDRVKWGLNIKVITLFGDWTEDQAISLAKSEYPTATEFTAYYQDHANVGGLVGNERELMSGY